MERELGTAQGSTAEARRGLFTIFCCSAKGAPLLPVPLCPSLSSDTKIKCHLFLEEKGPGPFIFVPTPLLSHPQQQCLAQALRVLG